ncbi:MAG: 3'-5' exonuclease [Flavobacteriaceae bacterium]|jgi:DNA polymerase III subunit epsilon|nr:3'-5' exonuclease [Flavobacteriaceae bacterium]
MLWFKKRDYPDFWNDYSNHFKKKQDTNIETIRFVVFDTETTGLNIKEDRILSIGTVAISDLTIKVSDSFECYLSQDIFKNDSVKIHGILKEGNHIKIEEKEAIMLFLNHIKNAVLVAHHTAFDMAMINASLKRMGLPKLKNRTLDLGYLYKKTDLDRSTKNHFSLDDLAKLFHIPQHDRHTASGDAYITALLFLKILSQLKLKKKLTLHELEAPISKIGLL